MVGKHAHLAADMVSSGGGCRNATVAGDPFATAAKDAHADNRSGSNDALEPTGGWPCSNGGLRRLLRPLPSSDAGTPGLLRGFADRYTAGERQLPEALSAARAGDDRRLCRGQPANSSMGAEVFHPAGLSAAPAQ
jgi:hypothetical protein